MESNKKEKIILCGSKGYNNISLDDIVDSFGKIVRCNMNINNNGYGKRESDIQVLNIHTYQSYRDIKLMLKQYDGFTEQENIKNFHKYINKDTIDKLYFRNNNTELLQKFLIRNDINIKIIKQIRCGLSFIPHGYNKYNMFMVGYSLDVESYETHQINNKLKKVNDEGHNRNTEVNSLIKLHEKKIVDATLCSIADSSDLTIDCSIIEPRKESLDILLTIYDKISLKGYQKDKISKLSDDFLIEDNKIYKKQNG